VPAICTNCKEIHNWYRLQDLIIENTGHIYITCSCGTKVKTNLPKAKESKNVEKNTD